MMQQVIERAPAPAPQLGDRPVAGKTGTTSSYRDAWFVGFTEQYVTGVWMGYDDNTPLTGVTGGGLPAEIWQAVMSEIHEGLPELALSTVSPDGSGIIMSQGDLTPRVVTSGLGERSAGGGAGRGDEHGRGRAHRPARSSRRPRSAPAARRRRRVVSVGAGFG